MPRTLSSPLPTLRRLAAASLVSLSLAAGAATPALTTQVPGYYRQALGGFSVTALYDGYIDLNTQLLKGIQADDLQRLLARMFLDNTRGVQTAVNAYLVHTGEQLVLVDTGAGQCFGPGLGSLLDNLRASGYAPEAVDAVLLTHLHPDHLCGLLDREGRAVFPNAKVWATQADADFWLSEQVAGAAPEAMRPFFKMAREAVAPYRTKGAFAAYTPGERLYPGISALPTPGHTPGHAGYLFQTAGKQLLLWGDIVHNHAVQFAQPDVSIEFDTDQKQAVATRKAVFAEATKQGWMIGGAHLPFPGLGHIRQEAGAYAWVPVEYGPLRSDR
ncbi:MAG: MBL fold metallo-hydrolase [Uliginosibacterium sp.]|jgi:glyoxylase-like metal-dependent hydrolase (beta-lactamase superfamily II)|nr:MBL fold metallo-hydrolase [Uliginosibacterium sp.]MBK9394334.1 MBL fold metallo-hydrolase [Uliginosibacterium sp.]MBK9614135.1 MBL fold metallo-hydrolase [Uliginosibacterium sp.]